MKLSESFFRAANLAFRRLASGKDLLVFEMQTLAIQPNQLEQLVTLWGHYRNHPSPKNRELFAEALDNQIRSQLPLDRFLGSILQGQESLVRQNALIMLTEGFLTGNHQLLQATELADTELMAEQLMRSISAAIRFARLRLRRTILKDHSRMLPIAGEEPVTPALRETPEQEMRAIELALRKARQTQKLTLLDQQLAVAVICEGEDYKKASRRLGISKSQGYRRIKRTIKVLRHHLEVEG